MGKNGVRLSCSVKNIHNWCNLFSHIPIMQKNILCFLIFQFRFKVVPFPILIKSTSLISGSTSKSPLNSFLGFFNPSNDFLDAVPFPLQPLKIPHHHPSTSPASSRLMNFLISLRLRKKIELFFGKSLQRCHLSSPFYILIPPLAHFLTSNFLFIFIYVPI